MAEMMVKIRPKSCSPSLTQARHFVYAMKKCTMGFVFIHLWRVGRGWPPRGSVRGVAIGPGGPGSSFDLPFGYLSLANEPAGLALTQSVKTCNLHFF